MTGERKQLQVDKFNGKLLGVCAGLAEFSGIDALWTRLGTVALMFTPVAPLVVLAYVVLGLILPKKPIHEYRDSHWQTFADDAGPQRPHKRSDEQ